MEAKQGKVIDDGQRIIVKLNRKKTAQCTANLVGASQPLLSQRTTLNSSFNKLGKRKRYDTCKTNNESCLKGSFLKNYMNFSKSGLPKRFLYHQNGQWIDHPQEILELVRTHFQLKNAAVEVELNGCHLLLDILYMIQVELKTGLQTYVAWIDEADHCFFPEFLSSVSEIHECCQPEPVDNATDTLQEVSGTQGVKLQLEIGITGVNSSNWEECVGESNACGKRIKLKQIPFGKDLKIRENDHQMSGPKLQEVSGGNKQVAENTTTKFEFMHSDTVKDMFAGGMSSSINLEILEVKHCSSQFMLEPFERQIEMTKQKRGNPNVQYGWLAVTKDALSRIMTNGLGHYRPKNMSLYGIGVHLSSKNHAYMRARYCDDDENRIRYIVLCRVILGNAEVVSSGSTQCSPSTEEFDNGVDDLQSPRHYIIWDMNVNTHIFPEYVVSFKMFLGGAPVAEHGRIDMSAEGHQGQLVLYSTPFEAEKAIMLGSVSSKTPKSQWMPFPQLFEAISKKVSIGDMTLVKVHYDLFKSKRISREDFIKRLRSIVGDTVLRSTLMGFPCKLPSASSSPLKVPKQEQDD